MSTCVMGVQCCTVGIEALGIMPLDDGQVKRGMGLVIIPHMLTGTEVCTH